MFSVDSTNEVKRQIELFGQKLLPLCLIE